MIYFSLPNGLYVLDFSYWTKNISGTFSKKQHSQLIQVSLDVFFQWSNRTHPFGITEVFHRKKPFGKDNEIDRLEAGTAAAPTVQRLINGVPLAYPKKMKELVVCPFKWWELGDQKRQKTPIKRSVFFFLNSLFFIFFHFFDFEWFW